MSLHPNKNFFRLIAGWSGLLFYVGAFSPIGIVVVALLGTIDPDHHALFQPDADGMRLVLHHEGNCAEHHHGTVAQALTMFAQPASATDPDHVVQFSATHGFTSASPGAVPGANQAEAIIVALAEPFRLALTKSFQCISSARPPPGGDETLRALHSTVLLI